MPPMSGHQRGLPRRATAAEAAATGAATEARADPPGRPLLRHGPQGAREGACGGGGADAGLRHDAPAGGLPVAIAGQHHRQHVVRRAAQRDGSAPELPEASQDYGFSKDIEVHHAASYFIGYSYNFCWCGRTLRVRGEDGSWQQRTPAMAAGLTGHVWSLWEWITYPARPR